MHLLEALIKKNYTVYSKQFQSRIATRGRAISRDGVLQLLDDVSKYEAHFSVMGTDLYFVDLIYKVDSDSLTTHCTCPYYEQWGEPCKHIFATIYAVKRDYIQIPEVSESEEADVNPAAKQRTNREQTPVEKLFAVLDKEHETAIEKEQILQRREPKSWIPGALLYRDSQGGINFQLGQLYVKAGGEIGRFKEQSDIDYDRSFGGKLVSELKNTYRMISYKDEIRGQVLAWLQKEGMLLYSAGSDGSWYKPKLKLGQALFFAPPHSLTFLQDESDGLRLLPFLVAGDEEGIPLSGSMEILSRQPLFILWEDQIIPLEGVENTNFFETLLKQTKEGETAQIDVPSTLQEQFRNKYASLLAQNGAISKESLETVIVDSEPTPELYLSEPREGSLRITLSFKYGDIALPPGNENVTKRHGSRLLKIIRSEKAEMGALKRLFQAKLKLNDAPDELVPMGKPLEWVVEELPKLKAEGWAIFGEKDLVSLQTVRLTPTVKVSINARNDWFDTSLEITCDGEVLQLYDLQKMILNQETGYRDGKGRWVTITDRWINRFRPLVSGAYEIDGTTGLLQVPHVHWSAVDELFRELDVEVQSDTVAKEMIATFRNFEGVREIAVEPTLKATLRSYQKAGYDWLIALQQLGCGGCLADDMGLGKTVMTIALLCREYVAQEKQTLIVAPTSVLFNWQHELKRFAPHLSVELYYGNHRTLGDAQIVLTSYAILRMDIKRLGKREWHYAILDEAQAIKNPAAQTTKAARLLKANHRLALTGTPIENGLTELWSLFSFINPGLLFSQRLFKEHFVKEIEQNKHHESASFLHRLVSPFLLRRTKELVTPELPPKTETVLIEEMTEVQWKLYTQVRDSYREELLARKKKKGTDSTKIDILAGLMRLRQICCHPALFDKTLAVESSAKFDMLDTLLDDIVAEGHKVLIFSQFVGMLKLTEEHLKRKKISSIKLTGRTRKREEVVEKFRTDASITAFLISLKAGGTGLNLVEADYVIHLDPWWNPAVEAQATDRVHRIGQQKPVFVYKCVMKDSVEEKILTLQEKKRDLNEAIIQTDESVIKSLTAEDIQALFS